MGTIESQIRAHLVNLLDARQDRNGDFAPQIVKKHQTSLSDEIENKILSMYGLGMSYSDISSHIKDLYGITVSPGSMSEITDKTIVKVKVWQQRSLESFYPFI